MPAAAYCLSRFRCALGAATGAVLLACALPAASQVTAHFAYAESAVGQATAGYRGVAVDGSYNVYLTASGGGSGHEVVRVPAADPQCTHQGCTVLDASDWPVAAGFDPNQLATDAQGDLYIAGGNAVLKLPAAALTATTPGACGGGCTLVGGTVANATGVAVDASGNVYIADQGAGTVVEAPLADPGCSNAPCKTVASGAGAIHAVAVDASGNVYTAPGPGGGTPYEFALQNDGSYVKTSLSSLLGPSDTSSGVSVDRAGNIYLQDNTSASSTLIYKLAGAGGSLTIFFEPGVDACISQGEQLALDAAGNLYLSNTSGDGSHCPARVFYMSDVDFGAVDANAAGATLSIGFQFDAPTVQQPIGPWQVLTEGASGGDFSDAGTGTCKTTESYSYNGQAFCTVDVKFAPAGPGARYGVVNLTDTGGNIVASARLSGTGVGPEAQFFPAAPATLISGSTYGTYAWPYGLATDAQGNIYVADQNKDAVFKLSGSGQLLATINKSGGFYFPSGVAVDGQGNVYVADSKGDEVVEMSPSGGSYVQTWRVNFSYPLSVAVDRFGNVYVANGGSKVTEFPADNRGCGGTNNPCPQFADPSLAQQTGSSSITGVAVDSNGNLFLADNGADEVVEVHAGNGAGTVIADNPNNGLGQSCCGATDMRVALDGRDDVFITDSGNNRVLEEPRDAFGDYSPQAQRVLVAASEGISLYYGGDITVDAQGNVYTTNVNQNGGGTFQVQRLDMSGAPGLSFLAAPVGQFTTNTLTLSNAGNAPLSFPAPASGQNPSLTGEFSLDSAGTCPVATAGGSAVTLAAGASCTLVVRYTPVSGGTGSGTLTFTDNNLNAAGATQTSTLTGVPAPVTVTLTPATLAGATYGAAFQEPVTAAGGAGPYTFAVSGGALPAGLSLDSGGALTGTPTAVGSFSFTITATDANSVSGSADYTLAVAQATPVIAWATPAAIGYGTALSATQLDAAASANGAAVAGTFTYTPAAGAVLDAGTQKLAVSFAPTDATDYTAAAGSVNLTVNPAATATALSADASSVTAGDALTLTATVTSSAGTPTGTVSFHDGTTLLGTGTLSAGTATYATSTLTTAAHSLTASYAGAGNFAASTSGTAVAVTVTAAPAPFTASTQGQTTTQTVAPGAAANFAFTVSPAAGAYPAPVTFAASGLPPGATATFSPASLAPTDGAKTVTLTIQTATSALAPPAAGGGLPWGQWPGVLLGLLGLAAAGLLVAMAMRPGRPRRARTPFWLTAALISGLALAGCGGSPATTSAPKDYTVTVTITSGAAKSTLQFDLKLQ